MADENKNDEQLPEDEGMSSDSGFGNLPPLSDFDSTSGASESDGGLPSLGSFDSAADDLVTQPGNSQTSDAGLDFASGSNLDTPSVGGGLDTPSSGGGLDTPTSSQGFGFQDLADDLARRRFPSDFLDRYQILVPVIRRELDPRRVAVFIQIDIPQYLQFCGQVISQNGDYFPGFQAFESVLRNVIKIL